MLLSLLTKIPCHHPPAIAREMDEAVDRSGEEGISNISVTANRMEYISKEKVKEVFRKMLDNEYATNRSPNSQFERAYAIRDVMKEINQLPTQPLITDGVYERIAHLEKENLLLRSNLPDRWIRVEDRLPENDGRVLIIRDDHEVVSAYFHKKHPRTKFPAFVENYEIRYITHWQPLPFLFPQPLKQ